MKRSLEPQLSSRGPAAVYVDIDALVPWDENPRKNDHAVDAVAMSIERFQFGTPIVARKEDKVVINGHTRLRAARKLGMKTVPVRFLNIDKDQARALAISDNMTNEIADWDEIKLDELMEELEDELRGICDYDEPDYDEEIEEAEATEDIEEESVEDEVSLLQRFNNFAKVSEDKSRKRKIWSKKDHRVLLGLISEFEKSNEL
tara:strand:- start:991 stop:1599 length:609 start_codon:yes stop_codon:yes gene_type:complete